jgi:hypothetical protein
LTGMWTHSSCPVFLVAHDTYKSAPNIRKKWPRYRKKYKKIITGHGKKI